MVSGVVQAMIYVSDLARAERFYVDLLGLRVGDRLEPTLSLVQDGILLTLHADPAYAARRSDYERETGVGLVFGTDEIEALVARLAAADVEIVEPVYEAGDAARFAAVRDPDGTVIEFAQYRSAEE